MEEVEVGVGVGVGVERKKCAKWMPKKNRYCANAPLHPSSLYCGNHSSRSDAVWLPCPIDPSHQVLQQNMDSHLKKCPFFIQAQTLSLQPYYLQGINAGTDPDSDNPLPTSSAMKRSLLYSFTPLHFSTLLSNIRSIHSSLCSTIPFSYRVPPHCHAWIQSLISRNLPYQHKHLLQQSSILANLEDFSLLPPTLPLPHHHPNAVVEFGAGRGYLTQILADCYGVTKVFLVERKAYKLKADRSLRQKQDLTLERLRIDIEDLNLNAVQSLKGMSYLAIGKHLCGPATDLTLRCCLAENYDQDNTTEQSVRQNLRGIAVATCCHHLCQWKHYTNKRYLMNLGITKDDFHAITWFTSWAVDADHGSNISDDGFLQSAAPQGGSDEPCGDANGVEGMLRNIKPSDRAVLGFMCKDIIDVGRMLWVKECGLESKLVKYVPSDISPENRLIVARAK